MIRYIIKITLHSMFSLLLLSSMAGADGTEIDVITGNTIVPVQNGNIRMLSERVDISDSMDVEALFEFENLSNKNVEIKMGFPFPRGDNHPDFKVWIEDKAVIVNKGQLYEKNDVVLKDRFGFAFNMYFWNVAFEAHERKKIKVNYSGEWGQPIHGQPRMYFIYITKTGSFWSGSIGKADFYMKLPQKGVMHYLKDKRYHFKLSIKPDGYILKDDQIEWHFTDWKPKQNIGVAMVEDEEAEKAFMKLMRDSEKITVMSRSEVIAEQNAIKKCKDYFEKKKYEGDKRYYDQQDIEKWRELEPPGIDDKVVRRLYIKALRNEIYARHGMFFSTYEMHEIFYSAPWYKRRPPADLRAIESELNEIEKKNVTFLYEYEKKMGWK